MKTKISVNIIILSKTSSPEIYAMVLKCISSVIESNVETPEAHLRVILVESNKNYLEEGYNYPSHVTVIVPPEEFNFHQFMNIGIKHSEADYYALCNNDLVVSKDWLLAIFELKERYPHISSFSPYDEKGNHHFTVEATKGRSHVLGYTGGVELMGWCIVLDKATLDVIGPLDEKFDFYYADDDYGASLRRYNLLHAMVFDSHVQHIGGAVTKAEEANQKELNYRPQTTDDSIPRYLLKPKYKYVLNNPTMLKGHLTFHKKWGHPFILGIKERISNRLLSIGGSKWINRTLFRPS